MVSSGSFITQKAFKLLLSPGLTPAQLKIDEIRYKTIKWMISDGKFPKRPVQSPPHPNFRSLACLSIIYQLFMMWTKNGKLSDANSLESLMDSSKCCLFSLWSCRLYVKWAVACFCQIMNIEKLLTMKFRFVSFFISSIFNFWAFSLNFFYMFYTRSVSSWCPELHL